MRALKQRLQSMLKRVGIYYRLKNSRLYDLYWRVADRKWIDARDKELEFYRGFLSGFRNGDLVFDVGETTEAKPILFCDLVHVLLALTRMKSTRAFCETSSSGTG
jgi:hypothetical protein